MEIPEGVPEKQRPWPWFVTLSFTVCASLVATSLSIFGDPEVNFWTAILDLKTDQAIALKTETRGPMIFVGGGSNCSFSIHADVLSNVTGMPTLNMGGSAGMGYQYLVNFAMSQAREGDFIILLLEPEILVASERKPSMTATKVALRRDGISAGMEDPPFASGMTPRDYLSAASPGAKFLATFAAKSLSGRPLYRYQVNSFQKNGVLTFDAEEPNSDVEGYSPLQRKFDQEIVEDLRKISTYASEKKIRVFYALPWEAFRPDALDAARAEHARFLKMMSLHLPVLQDKMMGAVEDNSWFLDTGYHMTLEAGRARSHFLAEALLQELNFSQ